MNVDAFGVFDDFDDLSTRMTDALCIISVTL